MFFDCKGGGGGVKGSLLIVITTGSSPALKKGPIRLKEGLLILLGNGLLNPFNGQHTFKFVS